MTAPTQKPTAMKTTTKAPRPRYRRPLPPCHERNERIYLAEHGLDSSTC